MIIGFKQGLRTVGPGLVTPATTICGTCKGKGRIFPEKDRCKKCKGECVTEARKVLEVYIPPGSKCVAINQMRHQLLTFVREGDRIVLEGEADQVPDQNPGDIVFNLIQTEHRLFRRAGADLLADIEVTLAESLCGFSRVVVKHLDGRGLQIQHPQPKTRVLKPGQIIKITGEGMPYKKSELRGDLYLVVRVMFPEYDWLQKNGILQQLKELLPKPEKPVKADVVDDVTYVESASLENFGASTSENEAWNDDNDGGNGPQCAQQ